MATMETSTDTGRQSSGTSSNHHETSTLLSETAVAESPGRGGTMIRPPPDALLYGWRSHEGLGSISYSRGFTGLETIAPPTVTVSPYSGGGSVTTGYRSSPASAPRWEAPHAANRNTRERERTLRKQKH
jgi:hypothetical protein